MKQVTTGVVVAALAAVANSQAQCSGLSYFEYIVQGSTFDEAFAICEARGAKLSRISSDAEKLAAEQARNAGGGGNGWIGVKSSVEGGSNDATTMFYLDGFQDTSYMNTSFSRPWNSANPDGNGECVRLRGGGAFDDSPCDTLQNVHCRREDAVECGGVVPTSVVTKGCSGTSLLSYHQMAVDADVAEIVCEQVGGVVAQLDTLEKLSDALALGPSGETAWVGIEGVASTDPNAYFFTGSGDNSFIHTSSSPWGRDKPAGVGDCVIISTRGDFEDANCTETQTNVVCEVAGAAECAETEPPTDPPMEPPSEPPVVVPSEQPTEPPVVVPSEQPSEPPVVVPSEQPSEPPVVVPSEPPVVVPSEEPVAEPTATPEASPVDGPGSGDAAGGVSDQFLYGAAGVGVVIAILLIAMIIFVLKKNKAPVEAKEEVAPAAEAKPAAEDVKETV